MRDPNRRARRPGQAMTEMSLVLMILLLLVFGAISALQILMAQYTVAQAARAAAHQAALLGGPDGPDGRLTEVSGRVAETARLILDGGMGTSAARATIQVVCRDAEGQALTRCRRYDAITVRIRYEDELWAPIGVLDRVRADVSATRAAEQDQQP
jgi:Flp pilus assembly protein TadG